jgi:bacterial/archaeal transporter family protein
MRGLARSTFMTNVWNDSELRSSWCAPARVALRATTSRMSWWSYALISALAASATAILAKIGVRDVPSNLATALRTVVILVFAWSIVFATQDHQALRQLNRRSLLFLVLSGVATGVSWLAYFKALQMAPASRVAPIDKASLAFTILLAGLLLGEQISWKVALGTALMIAGALLTLLK